MSIPHAPYTSGNFDGTSHGDFHVHQRIAHPARVETFWIKRMAFAFPQASVKRLQ